MAEARELVLSDPCFLQGDELSMVFRSDAQDLLKMSMERADVVREEASRPSGVKIVITEITTLIVGQTAGPWVGGFPYPGPSHPDVQGEHTGGP